MGMAMSRAASAPRHSAGRPSLLTILDRPSRVELYAAQSGPLQRAASVAALGRGHDGEQPAMANLLGGAALSVRFQAVFTAWAKTQFGLVLTGTAPDSNAGDSLDSLKQGVDVAPAADYCVGLRLHSRLHSESSQTPCNFEASCRQSIIHNELRALTTSSGETTSAAVMDAPVAENRRCLRSCACSPAAIGFQDVTDSCWWDGMNALARHRHGPCRHAT